MFQLSNIVSSTLRQYSARGCHRPTLTVFRKQGHHVYNSCTATSRTCSSHTGPDDTSPDTSNQNEPARPTPFRIPKAIADHLRDLDEIIPAGSDQPASNSRPSFNTRSNRIKEPRLHFEHSKESGLPFETLVEDNNSYREYISRVDYKEKNTSLIVDKTQDEISTYQEDDLEYDISSLAISNDLTALEPLPSIESSSLVIGDDDGREPPLPSEVYAMNQKALYNKILKLDSMNDLLEFYRSHKPEFSFSHYNVLTNRIVHLLIERECRAEDFKKDPLFLDLCNNLLSNVRQYDASMLLSLLKLISKLNLPADSKLTLTILQLLRKQVNELELHDLLFLDSILPQLRRSQITSALGIAIPIVLSFRFKGAVPEGIAVPLLVRGIFISLRGNSIAMAEKFMMALYAQEAELPARHHSLLVSLVGGLLDIKRHWDKNGPPASASSEQQDSEQLRVARDVLLKEALQRSALVVDAMTKERVEQLIQRLAFAFSKGDFCAYSQPLLAAYVDRVKRENWPLRAKAGATHWLLKMNQTDESLLECMVTEMLAMSTRELRTIELFVMPVIHALASSHVLSRRSEHERTLVLDKLLSHPSVNLNEKQNSDLPLLRLFIDLASIGYFEPRVMQDLWQRTTSSLVSVSYGDTTTLAQIQSMQSTERTKLVQYMRLWQLQHLICPDINLQPIAPEMLRLFRLLSQSHSVNITTRSSSGDGWSAMTLKLLRDALRRQPEDTLVAGVFTKHFMNVDFLLVLHPEGYLVPQPAAVQAAATDGWVSMDSIIVPLNAKLLGIRMIGKRMMLNNNSSVRSQMKMELKLLEAEGITPVPLFMPSLLLEGRTEEERVLYIATTLQQHGLFV